METKSRYEVISDLEQHKRQMIIERDGMDELTARKEQEIKTLIRQLEDKEEELARWRKTLAQKKETLQELIDSTDTSIARLTALSSSQKK